MHELLTNDEMAQADRLAIAGGTPGLELMEHAGAAIFAALQADWQVPAKICILCGPGNNGGDGFVVARLAKAAGYDVCLGVLGDAGQLKGDALVNAERWDGDIGPAVPELFSQADVLIDALFGAGLTRDLDGAAANLCSAIRQSGVPVIAVDVPSGVDGTTGQIRGTAIKANRTVTFFRRKPGHLLFPGRDLCGEVIVADIGISEQVLSSIAPQTHANNPSLWLDQFPWPKNDGHKYDRGHVVVVSGPATMTGASRLGARAALRIGAGLVTITGPSNAIAVQANHVTAIMLAVCDDAADLTSFLCDKRRNASLAGPGCGVNQQTHDDVVAILKSGAGVVLDADALTVFADNPASLFTLIAERPDRPVILTPHEGEFARLFGQLRGMQSKLDRARAAASLSGATLILKGPDTVSAAPDGRAAIAEGAPRWLATAGSGDVLAGLCVGLLAQKMPAFEAACASVWTHGRLGQLLGPGLIAEDLPERISAVLGELWSLCQPGHPNKSPRP